MMPAWLALGSLSLGFPNADPECVGAFKMYLNSFSFAHFFEFFTCVGYVGYNYGGLVFGSVCWDVVAGVVGGVVGLLLQLVEPVYPLVEGPGGELTVFEGCFDVV